MESVDCLCLNCEEMISYTAIEAHSRVCDRVADYIYHLENSSGLKLTHFKLDKLRCSMESAIHSDTLDNDSLLGLKKLVKVGTEVLLLTSYSQETITALSSYKEQVDNMDFFHSAFVMIYSERLKNLCMIKNKIISDFIYEVKDCDYVKIELTKQAQEFKKLEQELNYYKRKAHIMQTLINTRLSEVQSIGHSHASKGSDSDFDEIDSSLEEDSDYIKHNIDTRNIDINFSRFAGFEN